MPVAIVSRLQAIHYPFFPLFFSPLDLTSPMFPFSGLGQDTKGASSLLLLPYKRAHLIPGRRHLKQLDLSHSSMGPQGGQTLARALALGHLSRLEDFPGLWRPCHGGGHQGAEAVPEPTVSILFMGLGEALLGVLGEGRWLED